MDANILTIVLQVLMVAGSLLGIWGLYYVAVALFGFKKPVAAPAAAPTTRFAVLVAARNEQAVIGNLVDSLKAQNYPNHLYDIVVAPNNCTDQTAAVARRHGAILFHPLGEIRSKGDVMTQLCDRLLKTDRYDAVCVFDADNLVHPDFLQKMNDAVANGVQVAQGFRDSKNPEDTPVSTCYSVCYWMLNRFYNGGRQALGLSALINGCGFMVQTGLLRRLGGWHTQTMTEDYEFTAQCLLNGSRVQYVADAVFYDEQPLTFRQSWKQRRRWSTGSVQGMDIYLSRLLRTGIKRRDKTCLDLAVTFMMPASQFLSLAIGLATVVAAVWHAAVMPGITVLNLLWLAGAGVCAALVVCTLLAGFVVWQNRGDLPGCWRGIACFALFLLSWVPIGIISLFKPQTTWDAIAHTRAVSIREIAA